MLKMPSVFNRILKRGGLAKPESVHVEFHGEPKFTCSFCEEGCEEAYTGLKEVPFMGGVIPPHRTHACLKCYRIQWAEKNPDLTLPV